MEQTERLISIGKSFGLEGKELMKYVQDREKQEHDRAERVAERSERQRIIEAEQTEKQKRLEMELIEKQVALQKLKNDGSPARDGNSHSNVSTPKAPKLPYFDDSKDDMDAYLLRFERYASSHNWKRSDYAVFLSALLQGKALEVYTRMPADDATDYDKLKDCLLRCFQLTEDGFRRKFHSEKMGKNELPSQYISRIGNYFDRWTIAASVENSYEGLRDFLVLEQFLFQCPAELSIYLREKSVRSIKDAVREADIYMDAHHMSTHPIKKFSEVKRNAPIAKQNANSASAKPEFRSFGKEFSQSKLRCFLCDKVGHKAMNCNLKAKVANISAAVRTFEDCDSVTSATCFVLNNQHECVPQRKCLRIPTVGSTCLLPEDFEILKGLPTQPGFVGSERVTALRDTGCSGVIVKRSLVTEKQLTGQTRPYISVDKTVRSAPVAEIYIDTPYFSGTVNALCLEDPICELIVGNIPSVKRDLDCKIDQSESNNVKSHVDDVTLAENVTAAAITRSQAKATEQKPRSLKVPQLPQIGDAQQLLLEQNSDVSLRDARERAESAKVTCRPTVTISFKRIKGFLHRQVTPSNNARGSYEPQLVVPLKFRALVLKMAHESLLGGHMGVKKTLDKIQAQFYWPGMHGDISRFCQSCDACQRTIPRGKVRKVPLQKMPIISTPFHRVAVDLIGPLVPKTRRGNRYILTMVDVATRYPKAVALSNIDTITVAEAILNMVSSVGIPREILSDRGTQFTSDMMKEVQRLLSIQSVTTTPYHAQCNGLCEKYNGTLKLMLKRMAIETPNEWDRMIEPLLFAYRETPLASLGGFSAFELLYGRTVRGPMAVLRELWTKDEIDDEVKTTYEYVLDLRNRLEKTCSFAEAELAKTQEVQKRYFDKKTIPRKLEVGNHALVLLPTDSNKLLMKWKGPFPVKECVGINDYVLDINGKDKIFHINMLKKYCLRPTSSPITASVAVVTFDSEEDFCEVGNDISSDIETHKDVHINPNLSLTQKQELEQLVEEFSCIFSSLPGLTSIIEHDITLTDEEPIRSRPYPVPYAMHDNLQREIDDMLRLGVIEPSDSPYCNPIVLVNKKDGGTRLCADMRKVNKVTVVNCEPLPDIEAIFTKLSGDKFFSKLDCCKGYWQVPMAERAKHITAFSTPSGHYHFCRMPFGLVNSGATYARMMRILLKELENVDNFVDDVLAHTEDWQTHMRILRSVFSRIRDANITVKPTKCFLGYTSTDFVGYKVEDGMRMTQEDKTRKIKEAPIPSTKKQLRSFLGLIGYYRQFIHNFAEKATLLTDLTKKGVPNKLPWTDRHTLAFEQLKGELCRKPILRLPDLSRPFVLRTDASDVGLGAVLMQKYDDLLFPVAYISRKLLPRERQCSTIERECMAIVWAVSRFQQYLFGNEFVLQTDHKPLAYLDKAKHNNQKLMRWALSLQPYKYIVESIKGQNNVGADLLSRLL